MSMKTMNRWVIEAGKILGKAIVTGIGLEVARSLSERVRKKPRSTKTDVSNDDAEALRRERDDARAELQRLRDERAQREST
jgi:ribosomal protein L7/L12